MDSVEYLSLHAPQDGWRNIAPLPRPIASSGAVYFHGFVIIVGGTGVRGRQFATVYALKPPRLPVLNKEGEGELTGSVGGLGQWTKLSADLPSPMRVNTICRVGGELITFREFGVHQLYFLFFTLCRLWVLPGIQILLR